AEDDLDRGVDNAESQFGTRLAGAGTSCGAEGSTSPNVRAAHSVRIFPKSDGGHAGKGGGTRNRNARRSGGVLAGTSGDGSARRLLPSLVLGDGKWNGLDCRATFSARGSRGSCKSGGFNKIGRGGGDRTRPHIF